MAVGSAVTDLPAVLGETGSVPGSRRFPGGEKATHSSTFTWEAKWTEERGVLLSIGSQHQTGLN